MWDNLINAAGGNNAVASALGVSAKSVSQWRKRGIPARFWADVAGLANVEIDAVRRPMWKRGSDGHNPHNGETASLPTSDDYVRNRSFGGGKAA